MQLRFTKLNFVFLAMTLTIAPLSMNAQSISPRRTDVHIGLIGGIAAGNYHLNEADDSGDSYTLDSSLSGGRVGIQGGVDFNLKGLVVGGVADWSWSNAQFKLGESAYNSGEDSYADDFRSTVKQMTTVRGRVGRHYGRLLPYVHGGLLVADIELKTTGENVITSSAVSASSIHNGFVGGAGVEYFVARHYSLSTEYAYNHINGINVLNEVGGGESGISSATENMHFSTLNVGFNYHF
jgi:opacity protein-like surface antigen